MIADALATLADGVALNTGAAGTYTIGDVIDLMVTTRPIGFVGPLWFVLTVDTTATSGGAATGQFALICSAASNLSSPTTLFQSGAIPVATLVQGYLIGAVQVPIVSASLRYLGLQQTTGTAAFTAGKVNAFFTQTPPARHAYPDGI